VLVSLGGQRGLLGPRSLRRSGGFWLQRSVRKHLEDVLQRNLGLGKLRMPPQSLGAVKEQAQAELAERRALGCATTSRPWRRRPRQL